MSSSWWQSVNGPELAQGDLLPDCLLHHYEIGGLLGLWQATSNGGKNVEVEYRRTGWFHCWRPGAVGGL